MKYFTHCSSVSIVNFEHVTGWESNKTFIVAKKFHEMQRRDTNSVKTNSSKKISMFEKVGNIKSAS